MTATTAADADEARRLRDEMTDKLVKLGSVSSPQIEAAFRAVPWHAFARSGTSLEECYGGDIVRNKKDADGVTLSSISGAWLQARMIVPFPETLCRHATKPQDVKYGEVEMRAWYRERDLLAGGIEHVITAESSLEETVNRVIADTGLCNSRI